MTDSNTDDDENSERKCPNCGGDLKKTGNATPGNTPEKECVDCPWVNWPGGRPSDMEPPFDGETDPRGGQTDG